MVYRVEDACVAGVMYRRSMEKSKRSIPGTEVALGVLVVGALMHSAAVTVWPNTTVVPDDPGRRYAELVGLGIVWALLGYLILALLEGKLAGRSGWLLSVGTVATLVISGLHFYQSQSIVSTLDFPTSRAWVASRPTWMVVVQVIALAAGGVGLIGAVVRRDPRSVKDEGRAYEELGI